MKSYSLATALFMITALSASTAHAASITDSYSVWTANAGGAINSTTQLGSEFSDVSTVNLVGGGSFAATPAGSVRTIGSGWSTWSGGYKGQVLANSTPSVTLTLFGLQSFGFEAEPDLFNTFDVTVALSSGQTLTDSVNGNGGAQFFGYYGGGVSSVTISSSDTTGFAYGNFSSVSAVPLPASAPMFGTALLALAGFSYGMNRWVAPKGKKDAAAA